MVDLQRKHITRNITEKTCFTVLDSMLLNAFFAWNMSVEENPDLDRLRVKNQPSMQQWQKRWLLFSDEEEDAEKVRHQASSTGMGNVHNPVPAVWSARSHCFVCSMEEGWRKKVDFKDARGKNSCCQNTMDVCSCAQCPVVAHTITMGNDRKTFEDKRVFGMSCWDIAHSS